MFEMKYNIVFKWQDSKYASKYDPQWRIPWQSSE